MCFAFWDKLETYYILIFRILNKNCVAVDDISVTLKWNKWLIILKHSFYLLCFHVFFYVCIGVVCGWKIFCDCWFYWRDIIASKSLYIFLRMCFQRTANLVNVHFGTVWTIYFVLSDCLYHNIMRHCKLHGLWNVFNCYIFKYYISIAFYVNLEFFCQ